MYAVHVCRDMLRIGRDFGNDQLDITEAFTPVIHQHYMFKQGHSTTSAIRVEYIYIYVPSENFVKENKMFVLCGNSSATPRLCIKCMLSFRHCSP